ncbi:GH3 auxin-responsive promoter family protein [Chloroflexota bacterium]
MKEDELFTTGDSEAIWDKYCGFFDLSITEFMEIQTSLLKEQIDLISESQLAKNIMKGKKPKTVDDFRQLVPLTTYEDYVPFIGHCQEDALAEKPYRWVHTSGRGGSPKWIPYTHRGFERLGLLGVTVLILACAYNKGEVLINRDTNYLQNLPPKPFYSGSAIDAMLELLPLHVIPPVELAERLSFEERIQAGFEIGLRTGIDVLGALTTILIKMGEQFTDNSRQMKLTLNMLHPKVFLRIIRAVIISKLQKRTILPKDLWPLKGLLCYGMDTSIYREKLRYYWGKEPLEIYGGTEAGAIAIQSWNRKGMTFYPYGCFLEFIPEGELAKHRENKDYQPATVLLDGVQKDKYYEVVITNFYGMPVLRYRVGDIIKIIDLQDEEAGIQTPQMMFETRCDDIIDIAGFTRIDERNIWQAIANTGVNYADWTIRKEYEEGKSILHLYIETKEVIGSDELRHLIHEELRHVSEDYTNLGDMLGIEPLKLTLLPQGSFRHYYEKKRKAGSDLAHLKPPHMNATDEVIKDLLGNQT